MSDYNLRRTGDNVSGLLDKIEGLDNVTQSIDGLMSHQDKKKLDENVADMPLSILEIDEICNF